MSPRKHLVRLAAAATLSVFVSACALPPIVTAISLGADVFSLAGTGKTVTDNGISFVLQQDCAMLRVFEGSVCKDFAPGEDTPEGALVALDPMSDPILDPSASDPMIAPYNLAYLGDTLGLAVASAPQGESATSVLAFAKLSAGTPGAGNHGLTYLTAGIDG